MRRSKEKAVVQVLWAVAQQILGKEEKMLLIRGTMIANPRLRGHVRTVERTLAWSLPEEMAEFRSRATFGFPLCNAALAVLRRDWSVGPPFEVWRADAQRVRLANIFLAKKPDEYAKSWRVGEEGFSFPVRWDSYCYQCGTADCPHAEPDPRYPEGVWEAMWLADEEAELLVSLDSLPNSVKEVEDLVRQK